MARNRKTTAQHEASGSFDHDPKRRAARANEPVPSGPLGDPPEYFNEVQRAIWHELVLQVPEGVLTIADRMLVEIYCTLVARHRGGAKDGEDRPAPPETLKAAEYNLIISILSRMGLTPADRSRINAPTTKKQAVEDTFAELAAAGRGSAVKQ